MERNFKLDIADERLLENYDAKIESLYRNLNELKGVAQYDMYSPKMIEDCKDEINSFERRRRALLDKMNIKQSKEIWYKSQWFTNIISAIIGACATMIAAWLWK